ncbi:MAG: DUF4105 domain-containing protein [Treponema sp.]|nr:DUF4105 domain-containing protein [Treponema sp.]
MIVIFFPLAFSFSSGYSDKSQNIYPETLSKEALISVVTIDYPKNSYKSLFSKAALRIYDKNTGFDELIDFAHFQDFDDSLFFLKFYFQSPKAQIVSSSFTKAILMEKNAEITDIVLNLPYDEIIYIYDFLKNLHENLKNYSYDYDIQTNNSYTHISGILNDAAKSSSKTNADYSFYDYSRKLSLVLKRTNSSVPIKTFSTEIIETPQDSVSYKLSLPNVSISKIICFSVFIFLILLFTVYLTLVNFKKNLYCIPIVKVGQTLDFLILFFSGLSGTVILIQDFISPQSLFRNNFQFLYLFPLNLIMAFNLYFPFLKENFLRSYWSAVSILIPLYIAFAWIISREFPLTDIFISSPIFIRSAYFAADLYIKKSQTSTQQRMTSGF